MSKDSRADRRFNAIKKKYNVGRPGGVLASYDKLPYFKIHRFILNADEKRITLPDGTDTYLKMHDVGLYFILNMLAKEDGVNNKSHLVMLNSEDVKNVIKNMLEKSQTDTHSSKIIRESFEKLAAIKLIDCDIQEKNKSKVYQNISIPHEHEKYKAKGYFKFYYVDIIRAIEKINSDKNKLAVKDFLNLMGVYLVSSLVFFSENETDYLGNGVLSVDAYAPSKYANRIDFTFGLKITGGIRKKGIREYMDMLDSLCLMVSMNMDNIRHNEMITLYTFPRNINQFHEIIEDRYEYLES